MPKLYEIDESILSCIDTETGEIIDPEKLSELEMIREQKIESVVLWLKNLKSDAEAFKAEKEVFAQREKQARTKIESLSIWLTNALAGQKFNTERCSVTFRKSESVEVDEENVPKKYLVKKVTFVPDKVAIKEAIKSGKQIKGCYLIEKQNPQIK